MAIKTEKATVTTTTSTQTTLYTSTGGGDADAAYFVLVHGTNGGGSTVSNLYQVITDRDTPGVVSLSIGAGIEQGTPMSTTIVDNGDGTFDLDVIGLTGTVEWAAWITKLQTE